jgi:YggT family protein
MDVLLASLAAFGGFVRIAVLAAVVVMAAVATLDWAVRSRRLNPFGAIGRFCRRRLDPLMLPVERRLVRSGLKPNNAPWWATLAVIVIGLVAIALVDLVTRVIAQGMFAARGGPSMIVRVLALWTIGLLQIALFVRVITSWIQVSPYAWWVRWSYTLTEWFLAPLRRVLPPFGMVDLSPLVAYFALWIVEATIR